ncbi:MAG: SDR family oxidoreductase [Hyphomicrobiales bacterium]|nr:SDR family oxidoreductase [Hyphomicrobiales bacterium]
MPERIESMSARVALVTGAGQGIGAASARKLAAAGAHVVVTDIQEERARAVAEEIVAAGQSAEGCRLDVTEAGDVTARADEIMRRHGRIDVLVNNAGLLRTSAVGDIPEPEWDAVLAVNLKGTFLCSQAVARHMRDARRGSIVNIASLAGKATSTLGGAHYTAAKAGVLGLSRHLARELAPFTINVNAVCPGIVDTPMVESNMTAARRKAVLRSIPFGRFADPAEIGDLVLFLSSDASRYITGASIDIHGGEMIIQ